MDGQEKPQKGGDFSCHECLFPLLNSLDEEQITHDQTIKSDHIYFKSTKSNPKKTNNKELLPSNFSLLII